jgi:Spy/CpxP family protein refolding chaperone
MATDKKHIAVYLDPAVEQALVAFCQQRGLISKKGTMYSAGVNAALAAFFGIADIDNILQSSSNTPSVISTIPNPTASTIPKNAISNIPTESIDVEVFPGKLESGDSEELPRVDSEVAEKLQNELGNPPPEPEHIEFLKRLLAKKDPLISSDLWQEIERLKERNRQLRLKISAERRESIEKISDLEDWNKGLTRRIQERQAQLDELEAQLEQERADREEVEAQLTDREKQIEELRSKLTELKQKSAAARDLPEAADLLNQLKARRKKSKTDLGDVEAILAMIEES